MPPRFDAETHCLELAVADLLDTKLLRSIGFANRGGYERMWLGQAIHSQYQEQALAEDPSYRREVGVRYTFEHRGWKVTVQGRIDGLRQVEGGPLVVEEIKSVRRGASLTPATQELYARQAALYAWMLARQDNIVAEAELVLIEIGSDQVTREPVNVQLERLDAIVKRRIGGLILGHRQAALARTARQVAGAELKFPYPEQRPGQAAIIDAVSRALDQREHVLVEAPTGIGKTVASLYPAVRHALRHDKRVFVLTAKTMQQAMATEVLTLLNHDDAFRALRLRAKAKICANDQVICHEEYCNYAKDYYAKAQENGVTQHLLDRYPTLLPDDIFAVAKGARVCPFEISLELSHQVEVTVCDYNYAFDPYVGLSNFHPESRLDDTVLVVDEIHNLVERGRGYYSPTLSAKAIQRAGESVALGGAPIHHRIANLCRSLATLIEQAVLDAQPPGAVAEWSAEVRFPDDELWSLRPQLDRAFVDYLEYRRETKSMTADDRFVDQYFAVLKFLNALVLSVGNNSDDAFSHFVEFERDPRGQEDHRWRILCKDASRFLGGIINRCHTVIGLSATLSPHDFYRDLLGFDPARTASVSEPSPFPAENRAVVLDTAVATTWRDRPRYYPIIAERLGAFADQVPGNCLVLFPSYRFLAEVAERLQTTRKRVLVQARTDSDDERETMLHTLRSSLLQDVLLLAVAGGVFAEGVDYPGDMLKAVAVVGPCLPAPTIDQRLLKAYFDERFDRGFEYAFVVPGMTRVVQAAGRLIRTERDTGVIALFDRRFLQPSYRQHLPEDWLQDGHARHLVGEPADVARRFFAAEAARDSA